jgi:hypothetical protein
MKSFLREIHELLPLEIQSTPWLEKLSTCIKSTLPDIECTLYDYATSSDGTEIQE